MSGSSNPTPHDYRIDAVTNPRPPSGSHGSCSLHASSRVRPHTSTWDSSNSSGPSGQVTETCSTPHGSPSPSSPGEKGCRPYFISPSSVSSICWPYRACPSLPLHSQHGGGRASPGPWETKVGSRHRSRTLRGPRYQTWGSILIIL